MKKGIELRPVGKKHPRVIITVKELLELLELAAVEFDHNKNWAEWYPHLDKTCTKLEMLVY